MTGEGERKGTNTNIVCRNKKEKPLNDVKQNGRVFLKISNFLIVGHHAKQHLRTLHRRLQDTMPCSYMTEHRIRARNYGSRFCDEGF
ncbi:hypothetical protein CEXT_525501 [Caerostris extrusa]|uniref:Uncharacterized protein n=1 Tax=Caerostris extrusa TaxID=172846 RepID=A0AAV4Y3C8_CAEEX|nr:hypothetical protein CEXT_525501 [Caerostris extrusa]